MNTEFQKYVVDEIEEVGDIALKLLIPNYLLKEKKYNITSPIFDNIANYNISDEDFAMLKGQIKELIKSNNYCLYKYVGGKETWEKSYLPITRVEENEVLDNKMMWENKSYTPSFFISEDKWQRVKEYILETLTIVDSDLDKESKNAVLHYLNHSEYEMAFEGLFIEIMKINLDQKIDYNKALKMGQQMNLRNESTFDSDFWVKFETFCYNGKI